MSMDCDRINILLTYSSLLTINELLNIIGKWTVYFLIDCDKQLKFSKSYRYDSFSVYQPSFCPQPLLSLVNRLTNKVAAVKVMHELGNMDFYSRRMIWIWPWLSAQSASSRECWAPDVALFSRMISRLAVWVHWTASITEGRAFCSYWNRHIVRICICLPCTQCFCQNYYQWIYRMPYPLSWFYTQCCFWAKNSLCKKAKKQCGNDDMNVSGIQEIIRVSLSTTISYN